MAPGVWPLGHVEAALFARGLKPALKLEDLTPAEARLWEKRAEMLGNPARAIRDQRTLPSPESRLLAGRKASARPPITLLLGRTPEILATLLTAEDAQSTSGAARAEAIRCAGRLLGYPDCCTSTFSRLPRQDDPQVIAAYSTPGNREGSIRFLTARSALLNFFPPLASPVTWYPCSFACDSSRAVAAEALETLSREQADTLREFLSGIVLAFDRFRFVHLHRARRDGNLVRYESVSDALSAHAPPMALARSARLRAFRRFVTRRFAMGREVLLEGDRLIIRSQAGASASGLLLEPLTVVWFPSAVSGGEGS
jgi:hypothetical protein